MRLIRRATAGFALIFALLVGVAGAAVPVPSGADHDADHVHIEVEHGAHGPTLIDQSEKLRTRTLPSPVSVTPPVRWLCTPVQHRPEIGRPEISPVGRSPPTVRSRAPPSL